MASLNDWLDLAKSTVRSLETRQVAGLYDDDWLEMKKRLVAEHSHAIAGEPSAPKRFVKTCSALLYGITKRLTPQRRLVFAGAQLALLYALVRLFTADSHEDVTFFVYGAIAVAFVLVTALLGMELIDKLKFRDELELARALQQELIPDTLPEIEGLELAAFLRIANTVGGDIYDFIPLPDGRTAVLFGDASGHGMAAGLIMAVAHATFRTQLDVDPSPGAMFCTLNRILCQTGGNRSFFAAAYLLIDRDGRFEAMFAGHPPALLVAPDGSLKRAIGTGSYPLGIKRDYEWLPVEERLGEGDVLLLHSDGLIESRNEFGGEFGDERVVMMSRWSAGQKAGEILAALVSHWQSFCGRARVDDDVSIAVIRRPAPAGATTVPHAGSATG